MLSLRLQPSARRSPESRSAFRCMLRRLRGQPEKAYKAGNSWQIPAGVAHDAKGGASGAKVIVTYTVEKGQPLAIPAK